MEARADLTIWAVSDGRAGIQAQAEGLAQAIARLRPATVVVKQIGWRFGLERLPSVLNPALRGTLTPDSGIRPPWPDIWIGTGRASIPLSVAVRRWSGGRTFVVQTQAPRRSLGCFDLVIPPVHDQLAGPNVFPIIGAPNRLTSEGLTATYGRFRRLLDPLPRPRVAVVVGGKSKTHDLSPARAEAIGAEIAIAIARADGSVMVSFTRRTPAPAREILRSALGSLPGVIWDDCGENPYFAYLAAADAVLVTKDSTNLTTDAAATGKPVYVLPIDGDGDKFRRFHADLEARGITRPFDGKIESWSYPPLVETGRAAAELLARYDARLAQTP